MTVTNYTKHTALQHDSHSNKHCLVCGELTPVLSPNVCPQCLDIGLFRGYLLPLSQNCGIELATLEAWTFNLTYESR